MLDLWCGGTSAAHMGHAIPSAGMGCTGGKTTYGSMGETHTLLLERPGGGEALGKLGEIREHCGAKGSRTQIHRQSGNLVSSAACGLCVSLRSAPDLELVSLHWLRHSSQGGQPEFTRTMTLKCTYRDLHNTGV